MVRGGATVVLAVAAAVAAGALVATPAPAVTSPTAQGLAGRPPAGVRLSPRLYALTQPALLAASPSARSRALSLAPDGAGALSQQSPSSVTVEARASGSTSAAVMALRSVGASVVHVSQRYSTVTASVPLTSLARLGALPEVAYASEVMRPLTSASPVPALGQAPRTSVSPCGAATSEGDMQLLAREARDTYGVDGTGVRVGVLSDSYATASGTATTAAGDVVTGDLPGAENPCGHTTPVTVLSDSPGGTDEGRGMLQIVHDIAPGATLAFATANDSLTSFADNVRALRAAGADVIVDDVFYFSEPFFQEGPVDVAIDDVTAAGARYFTSAGNANTVDNLGQSIGSWEAPAYRPTTCPASVAGGHPKDCMDFDPTGGFDDNDRTFYLAHNGYVILDMQWAEPWYGVGTDFDIYLIDTVTGTVVATSRSDNSLSQQPYEVLAYSNSHYDTRRYRLVIGRYSGSGTPRVKVVMVRGSRLSSVEYPVSIGGDIVGPSVTGHAGTRSGMSIGAVPFDNSDAPETFSSRGPSTTYFGPVVGSTPAAALPTPIVAAKPDFAATDGGATTFFGELDSGTWRFYGTSAAAPHAAGVAALMVARNPAITAAQTRATMAGTAVIVAEGTTASVGAGLLDAARAVGGSLAPGTPVIASVTGGDGSAVVAFTTVGVATQTSAACTSGDGGTAGSATGASPLTVSGLSNGHSYQCQVTAANALGSALSASSASFMPLGAPSRPQALRATPGNARVRVTWTAPLSNGGAPVSSYSVAVSPAAGTCSVVGLSATCVGLVNGRSYSFTVAARNVVGLGPGAVVRSTPRTVPGAPASSKVTVPAAGRARITWTPPTSNGGSAVRRYDVCTSRCARSTSWRSSGVVAGVPQRVVTLRGLTRGITYTVKVRAVNIAGAGASRTITFRQLA